MKVNAKKIHRHSWRIRRFKNTKHILQVKSFKLSPHSKCELHPASAVQYKTAPGYERQTQLCGQVILNEKLVVNDTGGKTRE